MILTCPACTMRYVVSEGAIGPSGRRVHCAHCGHQWRESPEQGLDEALFGEDADFALEQDLAAAEASEANHSPETVYISVDDEQTSEDTETDFQSILRKEIDASPIPEGVKPEADDPVLAQLGQKSKRKVLKAPPEKLSGYMVAACIYLLLFVGFLVLQPQISRAWPPSNLIYDLVGLKPVMPGEGLSLEELHAEVKDGQVNLSGTIVNLKAKDLKVPTIIASIMTDDDKVLDQVLIAPPVARLKAEGSVSFAGTYPKLPEGAINVNYAFSYIKVEAAPPSENHQAEKPVPAADTDHVLPEPAPTQHAPPEHHE